MAKGDSVSGTLVGITSGNHFNIQPPAGEEWVITDLGVTGGWADYKVMSGTNPATANALTFANFNGASAANPHEQHGFSGMHMTITNSQWLRITTTQSYSALDLVAFFSGVKLK